MAAAEEHAEKPAEAAPAEAAAPAPAAGGGNKLVLILTLVNMLATLGMVGVLFISFQKDKKPPAVTDIVANEEGHGGGHGDAHGSGHGSGEGSGQGSGHGSAAEGHGDAHGSGHGSAEAPKLNRDFGKMITLEQFTVNLSTSGTVNPKFARVAISLEVPSDDLKSEVDQKMAQVRNTIIDLFNSKKPSDLGTTDGRNYLKEEIKNALNSFLITGKVKGVFFTNFALSG